MGAKKFLDYKYGNNSQELTNYINEQNDREVFRNFVLLNAQKLDSLYKTFDEKMKPELCEQQKQAFIKNIVQKLENEKFYNRKYYKYFEDELPNNTFFMGFMRYYDQQKMFKVEFEQKFGSNFNLYMKYLKEKYPHLL